jgi:quercetin dioxygenase-like cupin family protein
MEIESLKSNPLRSGYKVSLSSIFFTFDLPTLIENMKQSHSWAKGELNSMILLKTPEKSIVLSALHEGTEVISHQMDNTLKLEVIEGLLIFRIRKETVRLEEGHVLTLHDNSEYKLITLADTVFLLTMENNMDLL